MKASGVLRWGLPEGWTDRLEVRRYGALEILLAGRIELVCTKLYALVDQGPASKHAGELRALRPTEAELEVAARWAAEQDTSEAFTSQIQQALAWLR